MRRWLLIGFCNLQGAHKESVPLLLASLHEPGLFGTFWIINSTNLDASVRLAEPTLLAALTDPEPGVGASAAKLLGTLAPDHPEVIGPLMKAAEDPVATVRLNALQSLAKAPVPFEQMLVVATKAFDDREPTVRNQAMTTLMRNAGGYRALDSNLAAALDNNDPAVRAAGATLLGRFGVKSKHAVPKLTQLTLETNEPDEHVRQQAGIALSKITPSPAGK
jgi:HEAT repeat protein